MKRFGGRLRRRLDARQFARQSATDPVNISGVNEVGFPVCQYPNGEIVRGEVSTGTPTAVSVSTRCPSGSDLLAIYHTHPGGVAAPSRKDISEARRVGAPYACISVPDKKQSACFAVYGATG